MGFARVRAARSLRVAFRHRSIAVTVFILLYDVTYSTFVLEIVAKTCVPGALCVRGGRTAQGSRTSLGRSHVYVPTGRE